MSFYNDVIEILENGVVSKSEVDLYKRLNDELEDELASTYDKLENAKSDVAREIFEEIGEALFNNHCVDDGTDYPIPHYLEELKDDIAKLKKKYVTEKL